MPRLKGDTNVDTVPLEMSWRVQRLMRHQGVSMTRMAAGVYGRSRSSSLSAPSRATMAEYAQLLDARAVGADGADRYFLG